MTSTTITFANLTQSNYHRWSIPLKSTLQRDGVWRIVSKEEAKPAAPADSLALLLSTL